MPIEVLMPALSPTMEKGNLAKWLKKEGDTVKSGDVIAEIETDKATMEVEAVDEGTLGKILVPEGTNDVAVNTPIADDPGRRRGRRGVEDRRSRRQREAAAAIRRAAEEVRRIPPAARRGAAAHAQGAARRAAPQPAPQPEPDVPAGTEMVDHDRARSVARRHGRGDAPRRRACS